MQKTLLIIPIFILVLFIASVAAGERPTDFRGIKWGTPFQQIKGLRFDSEKGKRKFYTKQNENLLVGNKPVKKILYMIEDNVLVGVAIHVDDEYACKNLEDLIIELYGKPDSSDTTVCVLKEWYPQNKNEAKITIVYCPKSGALSFEWMGGIKNKSGL